MGSLRNFIKDVRATKTLAEERSVITKESARIRTKLKDDHISLERRRKYVYKLLYLYILGEKTHFAQVECINLIASDDFADKRVGYLAAILLLDENQELLTLLTNLLNNDLNNRSRYVVSLAMNALGALTSPELARDLYADIKNILDHSSDPLLLKKALACAAKMISRDASLIEIFAPYAKELFMRKDLASHGVLIGVNKLIQSIILNSKNYDFDDLDSIIRNVSILIPELATKLSQLSAASGNLQYSVNGCLDPFLQVEILTTFRLFLRHFPSQVEYNKRRMVETLTQVVTCTPSAPNSFTAVSYEAVRTIFSFKADSSLRVLGVSVLGSLVAEKDRNTKYVSLNALVDVVSTEPQAVQKHRKFISRCIFDSDVSIQKRALQLTFAILNPNNTRELVSEILAFLEKAEENEKSLVLYCVDQLIAVFEPQSSIEEEWKLDVIVKVFKFVGHLIPVENITDALIMINNTTSIEHKKKVVLEIVTAALDEDSQEILDENVAWRVIAIWCIGEYADLILNESTCTTAKIFKYLYDSDSLYRENDIVISYVLMTALKLSTKNASNSTLKKYRQLIKNHTEETNVMLQTKAVQYIILLNQPLEIRASLLEPMPIFHKKAIETSNSAGSKHPRNDAAVSRKKTKEDDLLVDLLSDLNVQPSKEPGLISVSPVANGLDLSSKLPNTLQLPSGAVKIHSSDSVDVFGVIESISTGLVNLALYIRAKIDISSLQILVAVSKSQRAEFGPLSSHTIGAGDLAKQSLKILGSGKLKLRIKLNVNSKEDQFDYKFESKI